jgi:hypothetical protein
VGDGSGVLVDVLVGVKVGKLSVGVCAISAGIAVGGMGVALLVGVGWVYSGVAGVAGAQDARIAMSNEATWNRIIPLIKPLFGFITGLSLAKLSLKPTMLFHAQQQYQERCHLWRLII